MGRRRQPGDQASFMRHVLEKSGVKGKASGSGGVGKFSSVINAATGGGGKAESTPEPQQRYGMGLVGKAASSNPEIAKSLKIAKQGAEQTKKKARPFSAASLAATSPTRRAKGKGGPASTVAGALGSSSGGSVRL